MAMKFFIGNTVFVTVACISLNKYSEYKNQKMYKQTKAFNEALTTLTSHKGAVHFLGEHIRDGPLKVLSEKKVNDTTTYEVKVAVMGDKSHGNMYFWLRRDNDDSDVELYRIELQIHEMENSLLIKNVEPA